MMGMLSFVLIGKEVIKLGNVSLQHFILCHEIIALAFEFGNQLVCCRLVTSESVFEKLHFVRNL